MSTWKDTANSESKASGLERRGNRWLFVKGRLAEGRSIGDVRAQAETVYARLAAQYPATNENVTVSVVPVTSIRFHPMLDGYVRAASAGLLAAVGLVLLIAFQIARHVAGIGIAQLAPGGVEIELHAERSLGRPAAVERGLGHPAVGGHAFHGQPRIPVAMQEVAGGREHGVRTLAVLAVVMTAESSTNRYATYRFYSTVSATTGVRRAAVSVL